MKLFHLATLLAVICISSCNQKKEEHVKKGIVSEVPAPKPEPQLFYGIPVDSFNIATGKVKRNQNLSEILSDYNVPFEDIHLLSKRSKKVYDVRKLRAKADYHVIHEKDSLTTARAFVFEPSAREYVVYHFGDSVFAEKIEKPVTIAERALAAEITSSVYKSVVSQEASPVLVNKLVDVFAWQVDFFRIAKGDQFKVVFDEEIIDDKPIDIKSIKAAYFKHLGKEYFAIPFDNGEKVEYYDENGKSLRKTFLRAPLNYSRISSRFSLRRFHPVQKRYKAHLGTDYAAPRGTPIRTVGDGIVVRSGYGRGNGNYVKIRHNRNYSTQYLHMSKIAKGMKKGRKVKQGEVIGYVGSTGLATGPHLCFRFWKNGRQVDALKVDLPSSKGIDSSQMEAFTIRRDAVLAQLEGVSYPAKKDTLLINQQDSLLVELQK